MTHKEALKLALEALEKLWDIIDDIDTYGDMAKGDEKLYRSLVERRQRTRFEETGITSDGYVLNGGAITSLRQAIAEAEKQYNATSDARLMEMPKQQPDYKALWEQMCERCDELDMKLAEAEKQESKCNPHPKAPHGFNRNASHANDRYTCECEGWDAYDAGYQAGLLKAFEEMDEAEKQEPVAKNEAGRITWLVDNWPQNCLLYTFPPQRQPLTDEVTKLRGEIGVLVGLLGAALQVIETVEGDDAAECNQLMELQNKISYAIRAVHGIGETP